MQGRKVIQVHACKFFSKSFQVGYISVKHVILDSNVDVYYEHDMISLLYNIYPSILAQKMMKSFSKRILKK